MPTSISIRSRGIWRNVERHMDETFFCRWQNILLQCGSKSFTVDATAWLCCSWSHQYKTTNLCRNSWCNQQLRENPGDNDRHRLLANKTWILWCWVSECKHYFFTNVVCVIYSEFRNILKIDGTQRTNHICRSFIESVFITYAWIPTATICWETCD